MGFVSVVGKIFKTITGPLGVLEDWAKEPLKRWENNRDQANRDKETERIIRQQTGVETVKSNLKLNEAKEQARTQQWIRDKEFQRKAEIETIESELRIKEAQQKTDLEIRMQTEIEKINAETEQWIKDKEFQRMKDVAEAVIRYKERLTELQLKTIRSIGDMDIELRAKAQNLILTKTREYEALQKQAHQDAESEFERIIEKFSGNERIMDIMITNTQKKLASIIDSTSQFLTGLNEDIQRMNHNIDLITQSGQNFIDRQIENQFNSLSNSKVKVIESKIENADAKEV